jgi:hypothetical protein
MDIRSLSTAAVLPPPSLFPNSGADVVEVALLLPAKRAQDLIELSRRRRTSVAQILRQLIDDELAADTTD